jgi:hypothetical protein
MSGRAGKSSGAGALAGAEKVLQRQRHGARHARREQIELLLLLARPLIAPGCSSISAKESIEVSASGEWNVFAPLLALPVSS